MDNEIFDSTVVRPDERLYTLDWPDIEKLQFPTMTINDCLLVAAGFEERSIETVRRVCDSQRSGFSIGLIRYLPELAQNKILKLREICHSASLCVTEFIYDREMPSGMGEKICNFSQTFHRVFVDISGMSRLLIVQILVALIRSQKKPISILYWEAKKYPPSEDRFNQDHGHGQAVFSPGYLSSGIFEIVATPELSSVSMLGEAIRLVAFPSFDPAQLTNLIQELQPTFTELIHGLPPGKHNKWRTQAIRHLNERILDEIQGKKDHESSTLDYRETLRILLCIYAQRSMFDRLVVSPTGSKMQAVSVGLFRAALPDVQIVYPTPLVFTEPENHTVGMRQLYQLDLPTAGIRDAIKEFHRDGDETHWVSQ